MQPVQEALHLNYPQLMVYQIDLALSRVLGRIMTLPFHGLLA